MIKYILLETRPKNQYKNLVVFLPIIFAKELFCLSKLIEVIKTFIAFYFASSFIYIINDIKDLEDDKKHPKKRYRPIASGKLPIKVALSVGIVFFILSLILSKSTPFIILYYINSFLYIFYFKKILFADIITLSNGYIIRALAGFYVIKANFSYWLIILVFLAALFLSSLKRTNDGKEEYEFINSSSLASLILAWLLYIKEKNNIFLLFTLPFFIYVLFKIHHISTKNKKLDFSNDIIQKDIVVSSLIIFLIILISIYF